MAEALPNVLQLRVVLEEDGDQVLTLAQSLKPDLLLLDINLPKLTGDQVVRKLREHPETAHLRCIALSADAMTEQR